MFVFQFIGMFVVIEAMVWLVAFLSSWLMIELNKDLEIGALAVGAYCFAGVMIVGTLGNLALTAYLCGLRFVAV